MKIKAKECDACGHKNCPGWQEGEPVHEYRGKGSWFLGCHCDGCTRARNESGGFLGALAGHLRGGSDEHRGIEPGVKNEAATPGAAN